MGFVTNSHFAAKLHKIKHPLGGSIKECSFSFSMERGLTRTILKEKHDNILMIKVI
jgi:hypothetical protein